MNPQIQPYLPTHVNLYFVDYRDDLCEQKELLQESLAVTKMFTTITTFRAATSVRTAELSGLIKCENPYAL